MNRRLVAFVTGIALLAPVCAAQQAPASKQPAPKQPASKQPESKQPEAKQPEVKPAPPKPAGARPEAKPDPKNDAKPAADEAGPSHKVFAEYEGEWQLDITEFADGKGEKAGSGTFTTKVIFAGRYMTADFDGRLHGKFFRVHGIWGYSNAHKRYEATWAETTSTSMEILTGQAEPGGNVIRWLGDTVDPAGQPAKAREVWTLTDKNTFHAEIFATPQGGKEAKIMELHATKGPATKPGTKPGGEPGKD